MAAAATSNGSRASEEERMTIPSNSEIHAMLDRLDKEIADDLETQWLDFKPWNSPRDDMRVALEYAICFANAQGGVVVFGVGDRVRGKSAAIHGAGGYDLDVWRRGIYDGTRPNLTVEVQELLVAEGTGKLLIVRVPPGPNPPYGTVQGLFKQRIGKNCMPMDAQAFARSRVSMGAVDWSGNTAEGVTRADLDPVEIARARNVLRRFRAQSELLKASDDDLLVGVGAVRDGRVTRAGCLLFGNESFLRRVCPQHQVHYVHQASELHVSRNDSYHGGLLDIVERIEQVFTGPVNPEHEVSVGIYKMRIPSYDVDVVREALLNAVTHRDYSDPNEVLIRHSSPELVVTSPGGFLGGITPKNILKHEPFARNRTLAEAFEKLGLVERAGMGRRRIFIPTLSHGKRMPVYESDGTRVTLRIFDGTFDERMAMLISKWRGDGREITLDSLLVISYLRETAFIDTTSAAELLQVARANAMSILDQLSQPKVGILERKGKTRAATYHLTKSVANDLLGKTAYTRLKGIAPIRYREIVRDFVADQGSINSPECRELLGLGESDAAKVDASRLLSGWSGQGGFLRKVGTRGPGVHYVLASPPNAEN